MTIHALQISDLQGYCEYFRRVSKGSLDVLSSIFLFFIPRKSNSDSKFQILNGQFLVVIAALQKIMDYLNILHSNALLFFMVIQYF